VLIPTFIVGVYGQNFDQMPELHWYLGYVWSWGWIVFLTVAQLVYFRRKKWV
jgi:magnesium transporter